MTQPDGSQGTFFEVSDDPRAIEPNSERVDENTLRAVALAPLLNGVPAVIRTLAEPLIDLGVEPALAGANATLEPVTEATVANAMLLEGRDRVDLWKALNDEASTPAGIALLLEFLGSEYRREATAGAAVLWLLLRDTYDQSMARGSITGPLDPVPRSLEFHDVEEPAPLDEFDDRSANVVWAEAYRGARADAFPDSQVLHIAHLARWRLELDAFWGDEVQRQLAIAALGALSQATPPDRALPPLPKKRLPGLVISTMIHGTTGWRGPWWRPNGDFHTHVKQTVRPNLYDGGARFGWSGALSARQRLLAARDFVDWSEEIAPAGLQTVFAHSYGGEVAAHAIHLGAKVHEVVLLSAPASPAVQALAAGVDQSRVVDIRLRFDPVLALTPWPQGLAGPNVTSVRLSGWSLDHRMTHFPWVWQREDIATRAGL